jgi:hypothetical protein
MSAGEDSRDAAAGFGDAVEGAVDKAGDAIDALRGNDDPPAEPNDDGDGDITININR